MLIVFGGRPGTGKTTISQAVAARLAATYLRIDAIEQAIRNAGVLVSGVGPSGYAVAQAVAEANVADGRVVVADCVNPVRGSRDGWRAVATRAASRLIEVEIICSDVEEHRRRVVTRVADLAGLRLPSWEDVVGLAYEPWDRPCLVLDTASLSPADAVDRVIRSLA